MRDGGADILQTLQDILSGGEPMAMSKAAKELREEFTAQGRHYDTTMKKAGGQWTDLNRGEPTRFKLVERPHGKQTWYFVALV